MTHPSIEELLRPEVPAPPDGLAERIKQDIPTPLHRAATGYRKMLPALAAGLFLALVLGITLRRGNEPASLSHAAPPTAAKAGFRPSGHGTPAAQPPAHAPEAPPSGTRPRGTKRDPFLGARERPAEASRPPGVAGFTIGSLELVGIVVSPDRHEKYAIVQGDAYRSFKLREGDRLNNGRVKRIYPDRVVFLRSVNDPLSVREYTEVVKRLKPAAATQPAEGGEGPPSEEGAE